MRVEGGMQAAQDPYYSLDAICVALGSLSSAMDSQAKSGGSSWAVSV